MTRTTAFAVVLLLFAGLSACADDQSSTSTSGGGAGSGHELATGYGCMTCHSVDSSAKTGPTWNGLAGSTVDLKDGSSIIADRAYLDESIREPASKIVAGFSPIMPVVQMSVSDRAALVDYILSLGTAGP